MKSNPFRNQKLVATPNLMQFIRKNLFLYIIFAVALPIFCIMLGWRTLDDIGSGFMYGSLCLLLFGTLTLFGNTVPAQLSKLSLPKYKPPSAEPHREIENGGLVKSNIGKGLFLTSLICGSLLFVTGLILKVF